MYKSGHSESMLVETGLDGLSCTNERCRQPDITAGIFTHQEVCSKESILLPIVEMRKFAF